jgi:hypothetical protein
LWTNQQQKQKTEVLIVFSTCWNGKKIILQQDYRTTFFLQGKETTKNMMINQGEKPDGLDE